MVIAPCDGTNSSGLSIPSVALWAVDTAQLIEAVRVALVGFLRVLAGPHVVIWVATS
jgi:hypothetical protein